MTSPLEQSERAGRLSFPTFRISGPGPRTIGPAEKANLDSGAPSGSVQFSFSCWPSPSHATLGKLGWCRLGVGELNKRSPTLPRRKYIHICLRFAYRRHLLSARPRPPKARTPGIPLVQFSSVSVQLFQPPNRGFHGNLENAKARTIRRRVPKCRTGCRDWVNVHHCGTSSGKFFADFPAGSHLRDRQNLETLRFPRFLGPSAPCVAVGELPGGQVVEFWIFRNVLCLVRS